MVFVYLFWVFLDRMYSFFSWLITTSTCQGLFAKMSMSRIRPTLAFFPIYDQRTLGWKYCTFLCYSINCLRTYNVNCKADPKPSYIQNLIVKSIFYKKIHKYLVEAKKLHELPPVSALFQWGNFAQIFASTIFLCIFL